MILITQNTLQLGPVYYVHPKLVAHAHGKLKDNTDLIDTSYDIKIKIV